MGDDNGGREGTRGEGAAVVAVERLRKAAVPQRAFGGTLAAMVVLDHPPPLPSQKKRRKRKKEKGAGQGRRRTDQLEDRGRIAALVRPGRTAVGLGLGAGVTADKAERQRIGFQQIVDKVGPVVKGVVNPVACLKPPFWTPQHRRTCTISAKQRAA